MNKLLQVRAVLQAWVTENHNSPDVPCVQKVIEYLASLSETKEGTELGKELLVRWVKSEFDVKEGSHE